MKNLNIDSNNCEDSNRDVAFQEINLIKGNLYDNHSLIGKIINFNNNIYNGENSDARRYNK